MKKLLLLICLTILAFSCKKNKQENESVSNGAITGSIGPAGTVTVIYATDGMGNRISATVDNATGSFKIDNLPAGKYLLSIPASALYYPMPVLNVEVLGGKTTDTGLIGLTVSNPSDPFISGFLLPAGFGTGVTATEEISGNVYTVVPDARGFFLLKLPDGDYTISFSAKPPVEAPQNLRINIIGKPLNLGNINCKEGASGSIAGKLNPQNAASSVKATNVATGDFVVGIIDYMKGTFKFPVMLPGNYKVSFEANLPYLVPAEVNIEVIMGKASDVGTVSFIHDHDIRVLSYKLNGSTKTRYNQACSFIDGALHISLSSVSSLPGIPGNIKTTHSTFTLSAARITEPGKYTFTGSIGSNMTLTEVVSSNASLAKVTTNWGISTSEPVGQLEVTAIDRTARTIRGTFSATLVANKTGIASKKVTEGNFYLNY